MLERDEPCDLMVVDVMMPGLSGADTVRLARRTRPALKALLISCYADNSCFEGELDNDVVLKKPLELETLVAAVRTALHPERDNVVPLRREQY
jgi:DNA-binding response OmpR family regulator